MRLGRHLQAKMINCFVKFLNFNPKQQITQIVLRCTTTHLVAVGSELGIDSSNLGGLVGLGGSGGFSLLGLVELLSSSLAHSFEATDELTVLPAQLGSKLAKGGVSARAVEAHDAEGIWDNLALDLVIGRGDTLERLQTALGLCRSTVLGGEHTANHTGEPLGGSTLVDGTTLGVGVGFLAQELDVLELVTDVCGTPTMQSNNVSKNVVITSNP